MSHLSISLLGPLHVTVDGEPVTRFGADTARALLACLSMHPAVVHRRAVLAGLLWPEQPDADALRNLRVALSRLRDAIGDREADPPFLLVSRTTIQLDPQAAVSLDVRTFRALLAATKEHDHERLEACAACAGQLGKAAALYRGEFLAGFSLNSAPFEEWLVVEREGLHWQALQALGALAAFHEGRGEYQEAIAYARRQVELEPWRERAHRQWMRALALSGHRGAALAQYEACRRVLADELGVEPEAGTTALYERIREGKLALREATTMPLEPEQKIGQVGAPSLARTPPAAGKAAPPPPGVPTLGQVEGERRSITAVLAHVEGATDLLARVGTEDWAEVMSQLLHLLGQEVARFGGEVITPGGDELVAFFGARTAHEDDPERAVLAALAMQSSFAQWLGAPIDHRMAGRLGLRIAVHAGDAVVTSMGDHLQQGQAAVMGEAIAFARQLLAAVRPGVTLVSERTFRQVAPLFDWEAGQHGHTEAAGQTWTAYRPLAHKALPGKGRGIVGLSSPLVGRVAELDALHKALERLQAGVGGVITLVGEAGIGKSRLVAEARRAATEGRTEGVRSADPQPADLLWVEGRCLSYKRAVAYGLWVDIVRRLLGLTPTATSVALFAKLRELVGERVDDVYPYLARMMSLPLEAEVEVRLSGLDGESLRTLTFRAVETLLDHATRQRALALVCEDLHWADPTSLALLEQALALTDRLPLLFICLFRPEMQHGCWQIKETATRLYHHRHADLWLHPLSPVEGERLLGNLLRAGDLGPQRVEELPHELRERILDRAEGNPFFIEETLRSLIDGGVLSYDEQARRWQAAKDVSEVAFPDTVRGVLAARIDRLPQGAKQVLQLASVIGRILPYPLLAAIAERSGLDDHLVALQRAEMIRERARVPEVEYIFKHVLTQEVTYTSLLRRVRRALHRRVAEALESMYAERIQEQLGLLAHHWEQAGEAEQAVHYLRRAGEQAAAQYANQEAITSFARALNLVPPEDAAGRYGLLLFREAVYDLQGDREAQYQDLTALQKLAGALADTRRQAEVALRQANYDLRVGDYQAGAADAQRAVSLAQAAADAAVEAAAYREWGRALFYQTDYEAARLQVERALAMARELGLCHVQANCLHTLGAIFIDLGAYVDAKVYFGQELTVCQQMGDRRGEGVALRDLGLASIYLGDRDGSETCLQQSLRICREVGNRRDEAWALLGLGDASSFYGDYSRAKAYHLESVSLCRETRARLGETRSLLNLGQVSWAQGAYGEALDYLEQSQRVASDLAYLGLQGWALLTLGGVYAELGRYGEARECIERSLHLAREMGSSLYEGYTLPHLALVLHYLLDDQAAWQHAQAALRLRRHFVGLFIAGYALTALGHVLVDLGHLDEAAGAYLQALRLRRRLNQHHLVVAPLAGLLEVAMGQGDGLLAGTLVEEVLSELNARPMPEGTTEPFRIHLSAYRALRANDDPRAEQVLHTAHRLLYERAAKIEDEEMRRSFLQNVPSHREIIEAAVG